MKRGNRFVIYTDGSCRHNYEPGKDIDHDLSAGGYAFMVRIPDGYSGQPEFVFRGGVINKGRFSGKFNRGTKGEHPIEISRDPISPAVMEMMAIQKSINYALSSIDRNHKPGMHIPRVWVYSDFKPLVDHLNDVIYRNVELLPNLSRYKTFHNLISLIKRVPVEFFHVRAHVGHRENEIMDTLAYTACMDAFARLQSLGLDEALALEFSRLAEANLEVNEGEDSLPALVMESGDRATDDNDLSYKNKVDF